MSSPLDSNPLTLGGYLRAARRARDLSREQLATRAAVSISYLRQLETGEKKHPSAATLRAIGAELDFGATELRHIYDLARIPPTERGHPAARVVARETDVTFDMRTILSRLEPLPATYVNADWTVLAANPAWEKTFPGYTEAGNLLRWMFLFPQARQVLLYWKSEAALCVQWFRAIHAADGRSAVAADLVAELSAAPEFAALWADHGVSFERTDHITVLRDPTTDRSYSVRVQQYQTATIDDARLYLYLGVPAE